LQDRRGRIGAVSLAALLEFFFFDFRPGLAACPSKERSSLDRLHLEALATPIGLRP